VIDQLWKFAESAIEGSACRPSAKKGSETKKLLRREPQPNGGSQAVESPENSDRFTVPVAQRPALRRPGHRRKGGREQCGEIREAKLGRTGPRLDPGTGDVARSLDWRARACALPPRSPGNQAELQDPTTPEGQDNYRAQNRREQQCYGQRQLTVEGQKVELDALEILQDEDEDHQQSRYADYQRRPGPAEPGSLLARIRSAGSCVRRRRTIHDSPW
jgi:hypothetical protein